VWSESSIPIETPPVKDRMGVVPVQSYHRTKIKIMPNYKDIESIKEGVVYLLDDEQASEIIVGIKREKSETLADGKTANPDAGKPYWLLSIDGTTFTCDIPKVVADLESSSVHSLKLKAGEYKSKAKATFDEMVMGFQFVSHKTHAGVRNRAMNKAYTAKVTTENFFDGVDFHAQLGLVKPNVLANAPAVEEKA
jgi:hypothetical protein